MKNSKGGEKKGTWVRAVMDRQVEGRHQKGGWMVKAFDGNTKELLKIRGVGGGRRKNSRRRESKGVMPPSPRPLSQDVESICPSLQNDWTAARPGHPSSHCTGKLALLKASSPLKFYSFPFLWEFLCCAICRIVFRFAAYQRNCVLFLLLWQTQNPGNEKKN